MGSDVWRQKKEAYVSAVKYFELASRIPRALRRPTRGFSAGLPTRAKVRRKWTSQELADATPEQRALAGSERDELRSKSEDP